jgi:hypothetical protein
MTEEALFDLARNAPAADRAPLLDRECAGDQLRRARIEALVSAQERLDAGSCHETKPLVPGLTGAATAPSTSDEPLVARRAEGVGSLLAGKYTLLEEIGEGGMGSVFLAQ